MIGRKQLTWVRDNRREPVIPTRLGDAARRSLHRLSQARANERNEEAVWLVARELGDQFERHCRFMGIAAGVLSVGVDDARLVNVFRLNWSYTLVERLQQACPASQIREVRFVRAGSPR